MSPPPLSPGTQDLIRRLGTLDMKTSQAKISERIQALEHEIRVLRGHHNATTPTCRLPPEILSTIFNYIGIESCKMVEYGLGVSSDVVRVTRVCKLWREVALNCRELWSNLDFGYPSLTKAMLERSKGMPLAVNYWGSMNSDIDNHFRHTMLQLKNEALPVQHLWLTNIDISWQMIPLCERVTVLALFASPKATNNRHSLLEFSQSLGTMSQLRSLSLYQYLPCNDSSESPPTAHKHRVKLQFLCFLDLEDSLGNLAQFFCITQLPEDICPNVSHRGALSQDLEAEFSRLISSMQSSLGRTSGASASPRKLTIFQDDLLEVFTHDSSITISGMLDNPRATCAYIDGLATAYDFSKLTKVVLIDLEASAWNGDVWSRLGQVASNLQNIIFHKTPLVGFLDALGGYDDSTHSTPLFPSLSEIRLISIDMKLRTHLIHDLKKRAEQGYSVPDLRLEKVTNFTRADLKGIKDAVAVKVTWDKCVSYSPISDWSEHDELHSNDSNSDRDDGLNEV